MLLLLYLDIVMDRVGSMTILQNHHDAIFSTVLGQGVAFNLQ
jgi:hypothetical protein